MRCVFVLSFSLSLLACGDVPSKKLPTNSSTNNTATNNTATNNTATNNTATNNTATNNTATNNVDPALCGNGTIDAGEACDSGIATGPGSCPNTCSNDNICAVSRVVGTAAQCSARCEVEPITVCKDDDGCCPATCNFGVDNDCRATCGDGIIDENETCDGEDCPTSCESTNACAPAVLQGSAATCNATCVTTPIATCRNNDGCCAPGCTANNDNDCSATCGNSIVELGETCDGNCPTQCSDSNACTTDTLVGSAAACSARCQFNPITACQSGDGCCPAGCTFAQDSDCACVPLTCQPGQCGMISNGCGGSLNCQGCTAGKVCTNNQCVTQQILRPAGSACTQDSQCAGTNAFCETYRDFFDGYCSSDCRTDNDCGSGSHCGYKDDDGNGSCLDSCTSHAFCRTNYECIPSEEASPTACLPSGVGNVPIGGQCSASYECNNHAEAICDLPGYCTQDCDASSGINSCPSGSTCYPDYQGDFCAPTCNPGSCRSGFTCRLVPTTGLSACVIF